MSNLGKLGHSIRTHMAVEDATDRIRVAGQSGSQDIVDAAVKTDRIRQINLSVAQIEEVTNQAAANAQESASATLELNRQSQAMNGVVDEPRDLVGQERDDSVSTQPKRATGSGSSLSISSSR